MVQLFLARTKALAASAVAVAAVDRTISLGLKRKLLDVDAAFGALETHGRDVDHLARRPRAESALSRFESHNCTSARLIAGL